MSLRSWQIFVVGFVLFAQSFSASSTASAQGVSEALTWYDTLGFPDVHDLSYVRVATGRYIIRGNQPPENQFLEGFLTAEDATSFTVFVCSPPDFLDPFGRFESHPALTIAHFVRKADGPAHQQVSYEVLDFPKVVAELMARVHDLESGPQDFQAREQAFSQKYPGLRPTFDFRWRRVSVFSFARACQQEGLAAEAAELFEVAANIPDEQTGKVDRATLREKLQQQLGEAVLTQTEKQFGNPTISLAEILKTYDSFAVRYPANARVAYAQESAELLRKTIAEESEHHPKPLSEMSPAEQVAENIYQLRNMTSVMWIMNSHYPVYTDKRGGKDGITPIHRLVDLGNLAVPQLIEALDDRRFTRSMVPQFNLARPASAMRVNGIAQHILEHLSGRNFYGGKSSDGKPAKATTRQQAEAWWAEVQSKGEKQSLIEAASAGGANGLMAARTLAEKFPEDALPAIEAGIRASAKDGYRGEYVEIAGKLPGDLPLAFLLAQLTPDHGVYSQSYAAEALFVRGQAVAAVPAMIESWHRIQARLPRNEGDAFSEVGRIISFLARSEDARAIEALAKDGPAAPVQVRLALVEVFEGKGFNGGGIGPMVSIRDHVEKLPGGEAGAAIERLLVAALDDQERCFGADRNYPAVSFKDPRICDMASFVLATHSPEKYAFQWPLGPAESDRQIAKMRDRWRLDHRLPPGAPPAPPVSITPASEAEVASLLEALTTAGNDAARVAATEKIVQTFGLRALPVVRVQLKRPGDAVLRPLALHLASLVREVQFPAEAGDLAGKSGVTALQGQCLTGERLDQLAHELESKMPENIAAVTFVAERAGDGTGFKATIHWLPGVAPLHSGWDRDMAVRMGDQTVFRDASWSAEGVMPSAAIFRKMTSEFDKATQAEIDVPVFVRFRLQRGGRE